jgi:predicted nucleic acid-binding protein
MTRPTLYLETTVPSYLAARRSRDLIVMANQELTHEWWENRRLGYRLVISSAVLEEIRQGDRRAAIARMGYVEKLEILPIRDEIEKIAQVYFEALKIPKKAFRDSLHLAVCSFYGITFLMTWNCVHLANASNFEKLRTLNQKMGLKGPTICTPYELMEG